MLSTGIPVDQCPLESGAPNHGTFNVLIALKRMCILSSYIQTAMSCTFRHCKNDFARDATKSHCLAKDKKHTLWICIASSKGLRKSLEPRERIEKH